MILDFNQSTLMVTACPDTKVLSVSIHITYDLLFYGTHLKPSQALSLPFSMEHIHLIYVIFRDITLLRLN